MAINLARKAGSGGSKIPRLEDGMYPARLYSLVDLGLQHRDPYQGQEKSDCNQIIFTFEFPNEKVEVNDEMKPRILGKTYNVFSSENAALPVLIQTLDPTGELTDGGADLGKLVGAPCMVEVGSTSGGKAKVKAVSPPMKGMDIPEGELKPLVFDYDSPDLNVYEQLPQWIQDQLRASVGYLQSPLAPLVGPDEPAPAKAVAEDAPY